MNGVCTVKTIDDLIAVLQAAKQQLGGDAAIVMSQDEEGNQYGDILMFASDTVENMLLDDYRGYDEDPAVKETSTNKNVLVIYPNL